MLTESEFVEVFEMYYRPLCFFCDKMIKSKDDSEDIVQDAFIKLHDRLLLSSVETSKAFLYITVSNKSKNYLRHEKSKIAYINYTGKLSASNELTTLDLMIHSELMRLVINHIEGMPGDKRRQIFKLAWIEGHKNYEIAELFGISVNTVKEHKGKGLVWLRKRLFDLLGIKNADKFLKEY